MSQSGSEEFSLVTMFYNNMILKASPMTKKITGMFMDLAVMYGMYAMFRTGGLVNNMFKTYILKGMFGMEIKDEEPEKTKEPTTPTT